MNAAKVETFECNRDIQGDYSGILARMYKKCTEFFRIYKNVHSLKCTKKCTKFLVKSS